MDREGFRNRMKQYKKAREENPGLKYWEWKAIPKYDEGGEVGDKKAIPTQEEYIAEQIVARKAAALEKSLSRTMPRVPLGEKRGERWNPVTKKVEDIHECGPSCAYTFSDNYGLNWMGSEDFKQNHANYGWKQVPWEQRQPGDAVLIVDDKGTARHTMMYDSDNAQGQPLFNHSNGGHDESAIRKKAKYPHHNPYLTYEFVGTPADSTQWINDYKKIYGFAEGGEVEPDPLDVLEASRPKVAGIPINDKPLSGTDPIGEAMMWGLGGGAASAALRSLFPTYGATAAWLAFGGDNKDNMLVIPNNPTKNTTPIETGLLNKEVRQYYVDDVLPRDILTSETDKLKFLNTDKNFEYDLYPQGYFANGVVGHYDRMNDVIRLNGGYVTDKDLLDNVMSHEVNHRYNREFPLDKEHTRILNRAYTVEPKLNTAAARAARKESEKRATNVNIRHKLQTDLRNTLGRKPTKTEMDKFIDSLSDLELLDRLGSASSYGSAYLMSILERSDLVNQPADQYKKARATGLRKALKRIAMNENKNDNNQNYA